MDALNRVVSGEPDSIWTQENFDGDIDSSTSVGMGGVSGALQTEFLL